VRENTQIIQTVPAGCIHSFVTEVDLDSQLQLRNERREKLSENLYSWEKIRKFRSVRYFSSVFTCGIIAAARINNKCDYV
jgi:hypothetical protein